MSPASQESIDLQAVLTVVYSSCGVELRGARNREAADMQALIRLIREGKDEPASKYNDLCDKILRDRVHLEILDRFSMYLETLRSRHQALLSSAPELPQDTRLLEAIMTLCYLRNYVSVHYADSLFDALTKLFGTRFSSEYNQQKLILEDYLVRGGQHSLMSIINFHCAVVANTSCFQKFERCYVMQEASSRAEKPELAAAYRKLGDEGKRIFANRAEEFPVEPLAPATPLAPADPSAAYSAVVALNLPSDLPSELPSNSPPRVAMEPRAEPSTPLGEVPAPFVAIRDAPSAGGDYYPDLSAPFERETPAADVSNADVVAQAAADAQLSVEEFSKLPEQERQRIIYRVTALKVRSAFIPPPFDMSCFRNPKRTE